MHNTFRIPVMIATLALLGGCSTISGFIDRFTGSSASSAVSEEALPRATVVAPAPAASTARPGPDAYPVGRDAVVVTRVPERAGLATAVPQDTRTDATTAGAGATAAASAAGAQTLQAAAAATPRVIYFDFDSATLRADDLPAVESYARVLIADPSRRMVIEGHADQRGGREYNLALGQKRAEAVLRALVMLGVNEAQLESVSFGEERPAVAGTGEEAWAQNRRVELKPRP